MSDEELRFVADRGGFLGVTMFPPFLRRDIHANVMDCEEAIDDTINAVGEDCVGIGTNFTQGSDDLVLERSAFVLAQSQAQGRLC
uniref:Dihydrodipicolinate synthase family protein n=2 Tax=Aromatoleum toluolicum TaxID=90060 RepID=A0ABX1NCI4_9RHOO|nr:hypothetical protein [Aromatoleum toluolicum]